MNGTLPTDKRDLDDQRIARALARGLAGDSLAYREFLESLTTLLQAFFRRRLRDRPDEVDDLVQEALLAVHDRRGTFSGQVPVTAWIHAIARYKFVDWLRSKGRDQMFEPMQDHHDAASDEFDALHTRWDLQTLLTRLPAKQQLSIAHVKLHGLSVREASRLTGMTEAAIKVAVHRGLKTLSAHCLGPV